MVDHLACQGRGVRARRAISDCVLRRMSGAAKQATRRSPATAPVAFSRGASSTSRPPTGGAPRQGSSEGRSTLARICCASTCDKPLTMGRRCHRPGPPVGAPTPTRIAARRAPRALDRLEDQPGDQRHRLLLHRRDGVRVGVELTFSKSTSLQRRPSASPRRMPVTAIVCQRAVRRSSTTDSRDSSSCLCPGSSCPAALRRGRTAPPDAVRGRTGWPLQSWPSPHPANLRQTNAMRPAGYACYSRPLVLGFSCS